MTQNTLPQLPILARPVMKRCLISVCSIMAVVVSGAATGYLTRADAGSASIAHSLHGSPVIHLKIDYELREPPASRRL